jgi:hypothetical protein
MSESEESLEALVSNWLIDVQRRGAELYAMNRGDLIYYLSFEGKDHVRFALEIDLAVREVSVQTVDASGKSKSPHRSVVALNAENLRGLAKQMCPLREGYAVIPVYLLAQLAILCHAYQRLIEDFDREHHIHTSTNTVQEIDMEIQKFLTPEERRRTDG